MNRTNSIKRNFAIIVILVLSVVIGFAFDKICDGVDRTVYPRSYSEYVEKYSNEYGVPEFIVYSVIKTESSFRSNAVSSAGAVGLMQITSDTFDFIKYRLGENFDTGMLYDPETNIKYGTYLLSYLYSEFSNWDTVFAAYNCGIGRVNEWIAGNEYSDEYGNLTYIPIKETREYVEKVNNAIEIYKKLYY